MIFGWIELKKICYVLVRPLGKDKPLANQLAPMLPRTKETRHEDAAHAFYIGGRLTINGYRASQTICDKLVDCYSAHKPADYLAPYTSMVGPSGIGKSFAIQQIAVFHGIYVVYTSLAREDSAAFPSRSVVVDKIPWGNQKRFLERFWRSFITASLAEVEACKVVAITPAGFCNLQAKGDCYSYQAGFANRIGVLFGRYQRLKMVELNH